MSVEVKRGEYFFTDSTDTYTQAEFDKNYGKVEVINDKGNVKWRAT